MKLSSTIANAAWLTTTVPACVRFSFALSNPAWVQRRILSSLLHENRFSAFGREHGFGDIRTYDQFIQRVPISRYDDLRSWIEQIKNGAQSVLTCGKTTHLLPTSGSSAARKLIPYTPRFQSELNAAVGPWFADLCRSSPSIIGGPAYWSISPMIQGSPNEKSAVPIGFDDDSAYLGRWRQAMVNANCAAPAVLRLVPEMDVWRYLTLLYLLRSGDLRFISIWHPSFLSLLLDSLPRHWDDLIVDIEEGSCRKLSICPSQLRSCLTFRPLRRRARQLRRASPLQPRSIWPDLQLVSCWGHAQAEIAMADLQRRIPGVRLQPKGLLATEACVTIPYQGRHPVAISSHFYEFEDDGGGISCVHDLEVGKRYEVIVTTGAGLWRYRLGDWVEVEEMVENTPSLRFLGRGESVSDLCGEKLTEIFATKAITSAAASLGDSPRFAMLIPNRGEHGKAHYTLIAETALLEKLRDHVEAELRKNPHYALCRDLEQLGPLRCRLVSPGTYEHSYMTKLRQGLQLGGIKPQMLGCSSFELVANARDLGE